METPTIIFWICTLLGLPTGIILCRLYKPFIYLFFLALLLSLCFPLWSITFIHRETYTMATRGFEIHLADLIAWILLASILLRRKEYPLTRVPPLFVPYCFFIFWGIVSWLFVEAPSIPNLQVAYYSIEVPQFEIGLYPLFEISKMVRGLIIFWLGVNLFQDPRARKTFIIGCILMILYFVFGGLRARYLYHEHRATIFPFHENDFNTIVGILGLMVLPWAFSTKSLWKSLGIFILVACCYVAILLTISRSSLFGFSLGVLIVILISIFRYPNTKNLILVFLVFIAFIALTGKAYNTLMERFNVKLIAFDQVGRENINLTARLMAYDHPLFGVGLGNFHAYSIHKYAAMVPGGEYIIGIIAHNSWHLTLAELGFPGFLIYLYYWLRFYQINITELIWNRQVKDPTFFPLILGVFGATISIQFQNLYHYSYRQTSVYFMTQLIFALVVCLHLMRRQKKIV